MTIQAGDTIPSVDLRIMCSKGPELINSRDYFDGCRVVMFAVPGAFTPTCSARHLPGYIDLAGDFFASDVDKLACLSVNDAFVMDAWGKSAGADRIDMLADGNADFVKALGLESDSSEWGMGIRSRRFAMIADEGEVTSIFVEQAGEFRVSSAEHVLANL
ncbi:MAG: peroxiredoxin [Xanthomonadales bacterium]|nr:peroxiredoxin [Xanthomonadales bacterium]NNL95542.1 peroxiredoxin [Xanthomonadales bacterium]